MSTTWFYAPDLPNVSILPEEEARHCLNVLRHKVGDEVVVTNGKGGLYKVQILGNTIKSCGLSVIEALEIKMPKPPEIHLGIAPPKAADRMEWMVEKLTETGISSITPLLARNSERTRVNPDRLQRVAIAAMKQSQKPWLPQMGEIERLTDLLQSPFEGHKLIAHLADGSVPLPEAYTTQAPVRIVIGPEGDFTAEELALAEANGFRQVRLSPYRLRTETAALVACQAINFANDLW